MDQLTIYISKIYLQSEYYLKSNSLSILNDLDDNKVEDIFATLKEYITLIERDDKEQIYALLPEELTSQNLEVTEEKIKEILNDIKNKIIAYDEYINNYFLKLSLAVNEKMLSLGFNGSFPKYYKIIDNEILFLEYDEDIYLNKNLEQEETVSKRMAMIVRIKNFEEVLPNLNIDDFTYLDLVTKYAAELQSGNIRSFMIHLPDLNYQKEMNDEDVQNDLKYLEVVETILNKEKHLPKWYVYVNRSAKDFERTYMLYSLLPSIIVISIIGMMIFGSSSTALLMCYLVGFILDVVLCKYFGKKSYYKYHPKEK